MNNLNVIEEIRSKADTALSSMKNRTHVHFKIKDIDFDGGVYINGLRIEGKPLTAVMAALRAKKEFTAFSTKMTPEDWDTVSAKLKATEGDTKMIARVITDDNGNEKISAIFSENDAKKNSDSDVNYENYFNWITESLGNSEGEFKLKDFMFDEKKHNFTITLLDGTEFNAFDNGKDFWKSGHRFQFNSVAFNAAPFFERLVCSNGNTAKQFGFNTYISQAKFNTDKIRKVIEKSIEENDRSVHRILADAAQHLKSNNVSMAEFYQYRNFFASKNTDGLYDSLLEKYFSDRPFYQAYGENIEKRSQKWKSTANTGINAYDFFNQVTWIASHPKETRISSDDQLNLQIQASNLLFKSNLDLEDIATPVKIEYPKTSAMF
jgi:hypothetical protein